MRVGGESEEVTDRSERHNRISRLIDAQNGRCAICGRRMTGFGARRTDRDDRAATVDHVIPLIKGGPDRIGNMLAVHRSCNTKKSGRWPTGCELIWLMVVNAKMEIKPFMF